MVDLATLQFVRDTVAIVGAIVAFTYYVLTVRNQNRARQAQIYVQIWDKFTNPDFLRRYFEVQNREWTSLDDFMEKYSSLRESDPKRYAEHVSVGTYFEGIGVLLKNGFIEPELVVDLLGQIMLSFWEKIGPLMHELRERLNRPRAYMYVEYLYNRVKPIIEKQQAELKT